MSFIYRIITVFSFALALLPTSFAAQPESMDYQGYLTDSSGSPIFGPADLTLKLYDAESGGTELWSQASNTFINNGGFAVVLDGSAGNPFPADLFSNPLWLGLSVNADAEMSPRQQLNSTPYSFVAKVAETATNALNVKGLDGDVLVQVFNNYDFGDGGPANTDPREGIADTDGDGIANFLDPDNDNDGVSDSQEIIDGSDINLLTPYISQFQPTIITTEGGPIQITLAGTASDLISSTYTISIAGFSQPGIVPTIIDPLAVRLETTLPVQTAGLNTLSVTLASNGESDTVDIQFDPIVLDITSVLPDELSVAGGPIQIEVDHNLPTFQLYTFTVDIADFSQSNIVPVQVDATTLQLDFVLPPQVEPVGLTPLTVTVDGHGANDTTNIVIKPPLKIAFITSSSFDGNLGGVAGADALCQGAAGVAGLSGTFKAWLGDELGNSPNSNFAKFGDYRNSADVLDTIAIGWDDLTDGTLTVPIRKNEFGGLRSVSVWTYALASGDASASGDSCQNWTSNNAGDDGDVGLSTQINTGWSENPSGPINCATNLPLYCFEQ